MISNTTGKETIVVAVPRNSVVHKLCEEKKNVSPMLTQIGNVVRAALFLSQDTPLEFAVYEGEGIKGLCRLEKVRKEG